MCTSKWSRRWREASELGDGFWKLRQQDFHGLFTHTPHAHGGSRADPYVFGLIWDGGGVGEGNGTCLCSARHTLIQLVLTATLCDSTHHHPRLPEGKLRPGG